jgi:hypothetical protein
VTGFVDVAIAAALNIFSVFCRVMTCVGPYDFSTSEIACAVNNNKIIMSLLGEEEEEDKDKKFFPNFIKKKKNHQSFIFRITIKIFKYKGTCKTLFNTC